MNEHEPSPHSALRFLAETDGVLAMITKTEGPFYREAGAVMAFGPTGARVGSLSAGCIEDDLAEHARRALAEGRPASLRYGTGSPFFDLKLPCGGGISVLLVPNPDKQVLTQALAQTGKREVAQLVIDPASGTLMTGANARGICLRLTPEVRILVFGQGIEAALFARLAAGAGFEVDCFVAGPTVADTAAPCLVRHHEVAGFRGLHLPPADRWTAVTLFFHGTDAAMTILPHYLGSDAFYVGAQGSRRARERLLAELRAGGLADRQLCRFRDRFGLIPSCRDPRTLAVSVLADVLAEAAGASKGAEAEPSLGTPLCV